MRAPEGRRRLAEPLGKNVLLPLRLVLVLGLSVFVIEFVIMWLLPIRQPWGFVELLDAGLLTLLLTPVLYLTLFRPLQKEIAERKLAQTGLLQAQSELELKVQDRTSALTQSLERLEEEVAQRRQAQAELLAKEAERAAAEERERLARDLHDAVTQSIYSANLIAEALPAVWRRSPPEALRNLERLRLLVKGALGEMRTLLFELRPTALEAADMGSLLQRLGDALAGHLQISVETRVADEVSLPVDVKVGFYRVTQEAFSNIAKHSRAVRASAVVTAANGGVQLRIEDDGCGFDPDSVSREHMGLRIMRERMTGVGASLMIESGAGEGTAILVHWPRDESEDL